MVLMGAAMWETAQDKVKKQPGCTAGGGLVTLADPALGSLFFPWVIPLLLMAWGAGKEGTET